MSKNIKSNNKKPLGSLISSRNYGTFAGILIGCSFAVLAILLSFEGIPQIYIYPSVGWLLVSICSYYECIVQYSEYERKIEKKKIEKYNYNFLIGSIGYYLGSFSFIISINYILLNFNLNIFSLGLSFFLLYKIIWWVSEIIGEIIYDIRKKQHWLFIGLNIFLLGIFAFFFYMLGFQIINEIVN